MATVDIVRVNLFDGQTEFIKAGAASSFWASEKSVSRIRSFTLPIGIVSGVAFDSKIVEASAGDILLLCSDGIGEDESRIAKVLLQDRNKPLQELTDDICRQAENAKEINADDRTAAAVRLIRYELPGSSQTVSSER